MKPEEQIHELMRLCVIPAFSKQREWLEDSHTRLLQLEIWYWENGFDRLAGEAKLARTAYGIMLQSNMVPISHYHGKKISNIENWVCFALPFARIVRKVEVMSGWERKVVVGLILSGVLIAVTSFGVLIYG